MDFTCLLIVNSLLHRYQWWLCLHWLWIQFSISADEQHQFTKCELPYHWYRRTVFLKGYLSIRQCSMTNFPTDFTCLLIVNYLLHLYPWWICLNWWWIQFSIGSNKQYLFTNGELHYHQCQQTVFLDGQCQMTDLPNRLYMLTHPEFFFPSVQMICFNWWWSQFSIGMDGQYLFSDGELPYHQYQRTMFLEGYLRIRRCQQTLHVYQLWILFSICTNDKYVLTDGGLNSSPVQMDTDGSNKFTKLTVG